MIDYQEFLQRRMQIGHNDGFDPVWMPDFLFDFQRHLVEWAVRKGRAAIFADCGMGKTPMQLVWAENVARKTGGRVLILTPLAVSQQTHREGEKFGIDCEVSREGVFSSDIVVTNYERLGHFIPEDFDGIVCDESSILKNYAGATRNEIVKFTRPIPYRLLCTATPSPNDYTELGNSVEALGIMRRVEMLSSFFVHDGGDTGRWRLKGHANNPFWRFVASWARAVRKPSDVGFDDDGYVLPALTIDQHILESKVRDGFLFSTPANTLNDQRAERRQSLQERCEKVASLAIPGKPFIAWCSLNSESELLAKLIPDCVEVRGSDSPDEKESRLMAFSNGDVLSLVSKPSICGFGMNWQHCSNMGYFPTHSHEQFYQCLRRCWRFGQKCDVCVGLVATESEMPVVDNLMRKERDSVQMFREVVRHMKEFYSTESKSYEANEGVVVPSWL